MSQDEHKPGELEPLDDEPSFGAIENELDLRPNTDLSRVLEESQSPRPPPKSGQVPFSLALLVACATGIGGFIFG